MTKFLRLLGKSKNELSTFIMLLILIIIFSIGSPFFLTPRNIMNIGTFASIMGTMAAGLTVAMLLGGLDVSQYALAAMAGMLLGMMIEAGWPIWIALILTIVIGVAGGCLNAFIITVMKVNPIIATIGTQFVFRGAAFILTNGRHIRISEETLLFIGRGRIFEVPFSLLLMICVYIIVWYILKYTKYGRQVYAVGGNPQAAHLAGINIKKVKFISHVIAGLTAVIGGIITVGMTAAAMPGHGTGNEMDGISAVILGGVALGGGKGRVGGTLIGVLVLAVLVNGMTLLNVQSFWQQVVQGTVLVLAVFIDSLRSGKKTS